MGLLDKLRSKTKSRKDEEAGSSSTSLPYRTPVQDRIPQLPDNVIKKILSELCPHSTDISYTDFEGWQNPDSLCVLCEYRDLARCVQVSKHWQKIVEPLLYTSIRLAMQHFCGLEAYLHDLRKKAKGRKGKPYIHTIDLPKEQIALLARTVRTTPRLANMIKIIKIPSNGRGTNADLARIVSATPNLLYIDLPSSFYWADEDTAILRHELQAGCKDIRSMKYADGAEQELAYLERGGWQSLEVLVLERLEVDTRRLHLILNSLPNLHDLTLTDMPELEDLIFSNEINNGWRAALTNLTLTGMQTISGRGLGMLLQQQVVKQSLRSLKLDNTDVEVTDLNKILWAAPELREFSYTHLAYKSCPPASDLPLLTSISLAAFSYNVVHRQDSPKSKFSLDDYYTYLASSLLARGMPALNTLYVRERDFVDRLALLPSPKPAFLQPPASPASAGTEKPLRFYQNLEVFGKGADELDWSMNSLGAPVAANSSPLRPLSLHSNVAFSPPWALSDARRSVMVGSGSGDFQAVPGEERLSRHVPGDAYSQEQDRRLSMPPDLKSLTGSPNLKIKKENTRDLWR